MLGGGPNAGTTTLVAGTPGVGKTLLALHFAAEGARLGEPVLFVGFLESAAQLRQQARVFGLDLAEAAGTVRLLVLPPFDLEADRAAQLIVDDMERRQARRLVIDSLAELDHGIADAERRSGFFSALVAYLRARQVTIYATLDIPSIAGPELSLADTPLSVVAENLWRYLDRRSDDRVIGERMEERMETYRIVGSCIRRTAGPYCPRHPPCSCTSRRNSPNGSTDVIRTRFQSLGNGLKSSLLGR